MYENKEVDQIIENWRPTFGNKHDIALKSYIEEYNDLKSKYEDDVTDKLRRSRNDRMAQLARLIIETSAKK